MNAEQKDQVLKNSDLVDHEVAYWTGRLKGRIHEDDLRSAGTQGLVEAVLKFDPKKGDIRKFCKLSIRWRILDHLRDEWGRPKKQPETKIRKKTRPPVPEVETVDALIKRHVIEVLVLSEYDKKVAAVALGISEKTLYNWLNSWSFNK